MARRWFDRRDQDQLNGFSCRHVWKFSYASLRIATDDFSDDKLIGKGGFAKVYKGRLADGMVVAVKKYNKKQFTGSIDLSTMVKVMSSLQHRNINHVIGCCLEKDHRILVTEYVENGTVHDLLRDQERKESFFNWHMRASVLMGIARGISYLHEDISPYVIHRDIKPSNILLDNNFNPKITDFDLAYFCNDSSDLPDITPLVMPPQVMRLGNFDTRFFTSEIMGTMGYIDPEYLGTNRLSKKTDVYAFGVVMLEIISGRMPVMSCESTDRFIMFWGQKLVKNDRVMEIVDPVLSDFNTDDAQRFIDVALLCTQVESKQRPSMHEVVLMLHTACNSCRQALRKFNTLTTDGGSHFSEASVYSEDEREHADSDTESLVTGELDERTNVHDMIVPITNSVLPSEGVETTDQDHMETESTEEQSQMTADPEAQIQSSVQLQKKKMKCGVVLSGSDDVVERLSKTTVFKMYSEHVCMEAVYPPFLTGEYQPLRSRYNKHR